MSNANAATSAGQSTVLTGASTVVPTQVTLLSAAPKPQRLIDRGSYWEDPDSKWITVKQQDGTVIGYAFCPYIPKAIEAEPVRYFEDSDLSLELVQDLKAICGLNPIVEAHALLAYERMDKLKGAEHLDREQFQRFVAELAQLVYDKFREY